MYELQFETRVVIVGPASLTLFLVGGVALGLTLYMLTLTKE